MYVRRLTERQLEEARESNNEEEIVLEEPKSVSQRPVLMGVSKKNAWNVSQGQNESSSYPNNAAGSNSHSYTVEIDEVESFVEI